MSIQQWEPGIMTIAGFVYEHQGEAYRARFSHRALDSYPPDSCPDLYDKIQDPT